MGREFVTTITECRINLFLSGVIQSFGEVRIRQIQRLSERMCAGEEGMS